MDLQKLREIREHLDFIDDRLTHRVRPSSGSLVRLGPDELERRQRDLAEYAIALKETLALLLDALDGRPGGE